MTIAWFQSMWRDDKRLRRRLVAIDLGLLAFWIYSVAYIVDHPVPKGSDGFEIFLAIPMTLIAVCLSLPALLLLVPNRIARFAVWGAPAVGIVFVLTVLGFPTAVLALCFALPGFLLLLPNLTARLGACITLAAIVANVVTWGAVLDGGLGRGAFWPIW